MKTNKSTTSYLIVSLCPVLPLYYVLFPTASTIKNKNKTKYDDEKTNTKKQTCFCFCFFQTFVYLRHDEVDSIVWW
ncbi:uncharacterized protein BO87DRAFT_100887 [Aspergillus neoniger CBS 115656]|uniref:Uncharacterized protein n=1 Tax=Aspergillus neoniger (strain CBS 115656) TaxID=1448310 RepID=A0A318YJX4_ASPNB|nr:hypothetical protein BO87DRAFT_100887 [Aspergillus neoniger CBS 115656]PYH32903.1 hypothetical protein BO87DRAFT_100887 [Aspergillus neoniger CBS 115656]